MGPMNFVASLGRLFGLFLGFFGFNIVSFLEIIYWVVVRGSRSMVHKKNNCVKEKVLSLAKYNL